MDLAGIQQRERGLGRHRASGADINSREFDRLFREYSVPVGRFLVQIVSDRSQAEDLMQETYLAAWRNWNRLETRDNPRAWLFSIARNQALAALRRRGRARRALGRLASEPASEGADPADAVEVRDFLATHLSAEDRILLILRYVHGFDSKELAQMAECSSDTIRQRLSRARRRIAPHLSDAFGQGEGSHNRQPGDGQ